MSRVNTTGRMLSFGLGTPLGALLGGLVAAALRSAGRDAGGCRRAGRRGRVRVALAAAPRRRPSPSVSSPEGRHAGEKPGRPEADRSLSSAPTPSRRSVVLLRMSTLFLRTLREDPADAEVPSHRLLVRGGYIRRAAPGGYTWLPLGWRVLSQRRAHRARGDGRDGRAGGALPGAAAQGALRADQPLDRVRRRHLPAQGPQGRRLPAGPDPRGDVHPARQGPLLVLQGPAAVDLPDPDEVPRRGAAARRAAARPRVRDEGLLLLRRRRRRARPLRTPRTARPTSGSSTGSGSTTSSSRRCPARWAARSSEEFLTPAGVGEDTYVRCTNCDYAANVEAVRTLVPPRSRTTTCPPRTSRTRPTRPRSRRWSRWPTRRDDLRRGRPRLDRRRHAEERRGQAAPPRRQGRAARDRPARRPGGRRQAPRGARRTRPSSSRSPRRTSPTTPGWSAATSGRPRWAPTSRPACATCSTRASSRAPGGSPAPTSPAGTSSTWSPAATSPATARSRPPRCSRATPVPTATAAAWSPPAASRWATSSSSAASSPTRSTSRCSTRTASRSS